MNVFKFYNRASHLSEIGGLILPHYRKVAINTLQTVACRYCGKSKSDPTKDNMQPTKHTINQEHLTKLLQFRVAHTLNVKLNSYHKHVNAELILCSPFT